MDDETETARPNIGARLTSNPTARRLAAALAPALAAAVLALLALPPGRTLAQATKLACPPSAGQSHRGSRACAQHGQRTHARSKAEKHHVRHSAARKREKAGKHFAARPPAAATQPLASCEEKATPVQGSDGSFSCVDGSEPACASGAEPAPSSNGSKLLCPVESSPPPTAPAICEDESAPLRSAAGSYSCAAGSEPACAEGSSPTATASGLLCPAPPATGPSSPAGEEFDSEGTSPLLASAS